MKVFIGTDHAGFELKEKLVPFLKELGYEVVDKGAFELNEDDDYPDFIKPVAESVASEDGSIGIILGGSGEGEEISANKIEGIRAAEYYGGNLEIVKLAREHNDANILSLGARFISEDEAKEAVKTFLETKFSEDERHIRRINKIEPTEIDPA
jgi:ribose 5-phosphate isomerase B